MMFEYAFEPKRVKNSKGRKHKYKPSAREQSMWYSQDLSSSLVCYIIIYRSRQNQTVEKMFICRDDKDAKMQAHQYCQEMGVQYFGIFAYPGSYFQWHREHKKYTNLPLYSLIA